MPFMVILALLLFTVHDSHYKVHNIQKQLLEVQCVIIIYSGGVQLINLIVEIGKLVHDDSTAHFKMLT